MDLVENSCSCRNWDLTGIPCIHALVIINLKDEFPDTYVQAWLLILPPTLRKPPSTPTKVKRHKVGVHNQVVAPTQQQATPNQQESTPTQQAALTQLQTAPTHQQAAPTHQKDVAQREKLLLNRKPTTVRWMPPTQESSMTDQ
ncbi:hypothetical protein Goshw_026873 [Gossypium schwendimanii]|uniref:SWIM-type domain-containing protein n=1 Tax=Gossypium schwendimanii TaxID=34291 RepID=A0A7J9MYL0_GOSSC|nr:hypothetical protein [Gossypium schwendimanii]